MKQFTSAILCFFYSFAISQKPSTEYNTKINSATRVEIRNGVTNILKADSVIIKIYMSENKAKIYLDSCAQQFDSALGLYVMYMHFINPIAIQYDIDLLFTLNAKVENFYLHSEGMFNGNVANSPDSTGWRYTGRVVSPTGGILVNIESKQKIQVSIQGAEGFLKH